MGGERPEAASGSDNGSNHAGALNKFLQEKNSTGHPKLGKGQEVASKGTQKGSSDDDAGPQYHPVAVPAAEKTPAANSARPAKSEKAKLLDNLHQEKKNSSQPRLAQAQALPPAAQQAIEKAQKDTDESIPNTDSTQNGLQWRGTPFKKDNSPASRSSGDDDSGPTYQPVAVPTPDKPPAVNAGRPAPRGYNPPESPENIHQALLKEPADLSFQALMGGIGSGLMGLIAKPRLEANRDAKTVEQTKLTDSLKSSIPAKIQGDLAAIEKKSLARKDISSLGDKELECVYLTHDRLKSIVETPLVNLKVAALPEGAEALLRSERVTGAQNVIDKLGGQDAYTLYLQHQANATVLTNAQDAGIDIDQIKKIIDNNKTEHELGPKIEELRKTKIDAIAIEIEGKLHGTLPDDGMALIDRVIKGTEAPEEASEVGDILKLLKETNGVCDPKHFKDIQNLRDTVLQFKTAKTTGEGLIAALEKGSGKTEAEINQTKNTLLEFYEQEKLLAEVGNALNTPGRKDSAGNVLLSRDEIWAKCKEYKPNANEQALLYLKEELDKPGNSQKLRKEIFDATYTKTELDGTQSQAKVLSVEELAALKQRAEVTGDIERIVSRVGGKTDPKDWFKNLVGSGYKGLRNIGEGAAVAVGSSLIADHFDNLLNGKWNSHQPHWVFAPESNLPTPSNYFTYIAPAIAFSTKWNNWGKGAFIVGSGAASAVVDHYLPPDMNPKYRSWLRPTGLEATLVGAAWAAPWNEEKLILKAASIVGASALARSFVYFTSPDGVKLQDDAQATLAKAVQSSTSLQAGVDSYRKLDAYGREGQSALINDFNTYQQAHPDGVNVTGNLRGNAVFHIARGLSRFENGSFVGKDNGDFWSNVRTQYFGSNPKEPDYLLKGENLDLGGVGLTELYFGKVCLDKLGNTPEVASAQAPADAAVNKIINEKHDMQGIYKEMVAWERYLGYDKMNHIRDITLANLQSNVNVKNLLGNTAYLKPYYAKLARDLTLIDLVETGVNIKLNIKAAKDPISAREQYKLALADLDVAHKLDDPNKPNPDLAELDRLSAAMGQAVNAPFDPRNIDILNTRNH